MASSNKRERELARAKAARQQARRDAARQRKVRLSAVTAVVVVLAVIGSVVGVAALTGDDTDTLATDPATEASATPPTDGETPPEGITAGDCAYRSEGEPSRPVEPPPTGADVVRSGTATVALETDRGAVVVEGDAAAAPCTLNALASLAEQDFYAGTPCHRLTTAGISVLQCGDPGGDGLGGPGYRYAEENLPVDQEASADGRVVYPAGTMAMAKASAPGTTGSQFFLVYEDSPLTPDYTVVGQITEGLDVVREVAAAGVEGGASDGSPAQPITLEDVTVTYG